MDRQGLAEPVGTSLGHTPWRIPRKGGLQKNCNAVLFIFNLRRNWYVHFGRRLNLFTTPSPRMKEFQSAGINFAEGFLSMMSRIPWYKYFPTSKSVRFVTAVRRLEANLLN